MMTSRATNLVWDAKLARLRSGDAPRALEICSGCGGLSLGLKSAGFQLTAHIEIDPEAAASYAINFGGDRPVDDPWARPRDMEDCSISALVSDLDLKGDPSESFDVLAAGLPCQAFARIGRSKLRSVSGQDDAFQRDPRASLYRRFIGIVKETCPLVILIENVPDILNFGGHNVPEEICENLEQLGYRCGYTILNAAYFGVPQVRERLFILALAECMEATPEFPVPTHYLKLPSGYEGSRRVALKHVDLKSGRFHPISTPQRHLPKAIGAREALADLPAIHEHRSNPSQMRRRKVRDLAPYRLPLEGLPSFARAMRTWPGFVTTEGTNGHVVRITPRDFPIFARMGHGDDYPQARRLAEAMFYDAAKLNDINIRRPASKAFAQLWKAMVPPYDPGKFPNKWWKLQPSQPSRTLTAHMGKDSYSHIHYDSRQARTVSVREAARLQSFPDGFEFAGAMNAAFRQIGNAVPPVLGRAVADILIRQLRAASRTQQKAKARKAA